MSAATVIEVLDVVGGWVHPDELSYQLGLRGERLNEAVVAGLCHDGRVLIEPDGLTLTRAELDRLYPPPLPPIAKVRPAPKPKRPSTRDLVLDAMASSDRTWWTAKRLASVTDRNLSGVFKTMRALKSEGLIDSQWVSHNRGYWTYALAERAGVLA